MFGGVRTDPRSASEWSSRVSRAAVRFDGHDDESIEDERAEIRALPRRCPLAGGTGRAIGPGCDDVRPRLIRRSRSLFGALL